MEKYKSNISSEEEFIKRYKILYDKLNIKANKTSAEISLFNTLNEVYEFLNHKKDLEYNKSSYCNMLPYFELGGGWEMMKSDIGKEATELLYYFVQNY